MGRALHVGLAMATSSDERQLSTSAASVQLASPAGNPSKFNPMKSNCVRLKSNQQPSESSQAQTSSSSTPSTKRTRTPTRTQAHQKPSNGTERRGSSARKRPQRSQETLRRVRSRPKQYEPSELGGQRNGAPKSRRRRFEKVSRAVNKKKQPPTNVNKQQCQRRPPAAPSQQAGNVNYWTYKQTGIKSRPIKLLKHPIEHIQRKIIITYLLSFLFKLIAILTGPLVVLVAYLITVPFAASRRIIWFLLNLRFTCNAKIKTTASVALSSNAGVNSSLSASSSREQFEQTAASKSSERDNTKLASKQLESSATSWNYCPLTYSETYWFKERLVNTVILVLDNRKAPFSIDKLKQLVRDKVLSDNAYRKFSCCVLARGIPFYKSYYWRYLEFKKDDSCNSNSNNNNNNALQVRVGYSCENASGSLTSSLQTMVDQFSVTSIVSQTTNCLPESLSDPSSSASSLNYNHHQVVVDLEQNDKPAQSLESKANSASLSDHIFMDFSLAEVNRASIRRYAHYLLDISLNMSRPLWEVRVITSASGRKTYLIVRCHQSLADGRSLSKILTDCLASTSTSSSEQPKSDTTCTIEQHSGLEQVSTDATQLPGCSQLVDPVNELDRSINLDGLAANKHDQTGDGNEDDETELKPLKEKRSFVARMSKSSGWWSAIFVGPLTVMLWVIWTFTRRKYNHLNKCLKPENAASNKSGFDERRFYMAHYSLTKFYQIKQMTKSTVNDVILCALSGALRDYLRKYNGVTNPPNLNVSLIVDMRQSDGPSKRHRRRLQSTGNVPQRSFSSASPGDSNGASGGCSKAATITGNDRQVNCALVNVPLPTSVDGTVPRLWDVRNIMDELRTSADPWVMLGLQKFLFSLLPVTWYQWLVNYISLRNCSTFVSNLHGPETKVEGWCVDLLQRAIYESQQPACAVQPQSISQHDNRSRWWPDWAVNATGASEPQETLRRRRFERKNEQNRRTRLRLLHQLGSVTAIYYCMRPPTSNIPISFNCISYQNKLFVSALSRSLLVEDSKLLIRLFFKQLDQLADTIAKRRSLVTIIRTQVPIEISCQPASPLLNTEEFTIPPERSQFEDGDEDQEMSNQNDELTTIEDIGRFRGEEKRQIVSRATSGILFDPVSAHKYDIETGRRTNGCSVCNQAVCTCRRRKSLFSFDYSKQRAVNLLSLLHPAHFIATKTNRSQETNQIDGEQLNSSSECDCGRQLLEELDCEMATSSNQIDENEPSAARQDVAKSLSTDDNIERPCCAECRLLKNRSSISLDTSTASQSKKKHSWIGQIRSKTSSSPDQSIKHSNLSINYNKQTDHRQGSPNKSRLNSSQQHSRSETDLLPSNRGVKLSPKALQQRSLVVVKDEVSSSKRWLK